MEKLQYENIFEVIAANREEAEKMKADADRKLTERDEEDKKPGL